MNRPDDENSPEPSGPEDDSDPWLDEMDDEVPGPTDSATTALPSKVESWRRRSATGAILTGFALGLQQALEPNREEPRIMVQTSGDPPKDLPVEAEFEFRRPRDSVINVRPWLLAAPDAGPAAGSGEGREAGPEETEE